MPKISFASKAISIAKEKISKSIENKLVNISSTPFIIDPEYVDKHITLKLDNSNREKEFISTSKQVKLGNYCICMQSIVDNAVYWGNKSQYALFIIMYIIGHIKLYGNTIELKEQDFINWCGCTRKSFYNGLNALLRPAVPHPCAADNMSLLAATTRKSIYVVNHNFIFRGNYDEFITLYELKFPNGCKLDSRGRVIIEK